MILFVNDRNVTVSTPPVGDLGFREEAGRLDGQDAEANTWRQTVDVDAVRKEISTVKVAAEAAVFVVVFRFNFEPVRSVARHRHFDVVGVVFRHVQLQLELIRILNDVDHVDVVEVFRHLFNDCLDTLIVNCTTTII